jgi:Taurine catabolism dioxygenase TauD, TfdA family
MRNTRFEVRPTSGALGAELQGLDLAQPLDVETAFNEHGVLFFRDQRLTPEQHIALTGLPLVYACRPLFSYLGGASLRIAPVACPARSRRSMAGCASSRRIRRWVTMYSTAFLTLAAYTENDG